MTEDKPPDNTDQAPEPAVASGHMTDERALTFAVNERLEATFGLDRLPVLLSAFAFTAAVQGQMLAQLRSAGREVANDVPEDYLVGFVMGIVSFNLDAHHETRQGFDEGKRISKIIEEVNIEAGMAGMAEIVERIREGDVEAIRSMRENKALRTRKV